MSNIAHKKRAVIVHCWGGSHNYAWYQSVVRQLEAKGYEVSVPDMPYTNEPRLDKWLPYLRKVIGQPDEQLVLVGHSIGTVTILRYLESLPEGDRIDKAILVAGFTDQLGFSELENFFENRLDFVKIKSRTVNGFVAIQSDDDPYVSMQYGVRLREELGATLVVKHGAGHMSGAVDTEAACTELPEVLRCLRINRAV